ncbi:sporulation integral membrane protein YlbJ [Alkalithermobacter thermoalcaliphilus JW-YL-7 = DSM 7308]|uniref:Sporulation integral membrane protein YlbJ n=1 Tax=Alkalithermobacter thermoalcaliphilus JW-YL-7 = DSM 7308 TaxID=1121328 RepID=A0A150FPS2_CLOPD|nr:sporulation integral membrane protein YlbJ [[Clostridium] paradoxum JW-YL-7 = DSM 7308]SHK95697.1 sporulation integral membrane protein YlbJ [[Clostridium] paradoxum JW-YL-7 = DSM 7308]
MRKSKVVASFIPGIIILILLSCIVVFPQDSLDAAYLGLKIWFNTLVPALLPFLIGSGLLIRLKVVDLIGIFLEPITQFVFRVSGKGAFAFVMSIISGYPVGIKIVSELREKNLISKYEGQRLSSFCSTSGPLFVIGAVGIGMFKNPVIGYMILISHYLSALTVGIIFRGYGKKYNETYKINWNIKNAVKNLVYDNMNCKKGFFCIFGECINDSINTILNVGGFIVVFSVVFRILTITNFIDFITYFFVLILSKFNVSKELIYAFISGLFEITIGCNNIASITDVSLIFKISLCAFLVSFSGISIIAQACSFLNKTDINTYTYILSKFMQGIISFVYIYALYPLFKYNLDIATFNHEYYVYNQSMFNTFVGFNKIFFVALMFVYVYSYKTKLKG